MQAATDEAIRKLRPPWMRIVLLLTQTHTFNASGCAPLKSFDGAPQQRTLEAEAWLLCVAGDVVVRGWSSQRGVQVRIRRDISSKTIYCPVFSEDRSNGCVIESWAWGEASDAFVVVSTSFFLLLPRSCRQGSAAADSY